MTVAMRTFAEPGNPVLRLMSVARECVVEAGMDMGRADKLFADALRRQPGLGETLDAMYRMENRRRFLADAAEAERAGRHHEPSGVSLGEHLAAKNSEIPAVEPGGAGQKPVDAHGLVARPESRDGGGRKLFDAQRDVAPAVANPPRRNMEAGKVLAAVVRKSILDRMLINGKPLGDCTPEEAIAWADHNDRRSRIVRLMASGVPPQSPIREFITPEEAERRAEMAN